MRVVGPEQQEDRELREWFETQRRGNIERLIAGGQTLIQLITGVYGVLFGVLALNDQPAYLKQPTVQWFGSIGVCLFFVALITATTVVVPRRNPYQANNLTELPQVYRDIVKRKATMLMVAQVCFVLGIGCVVGVILAIVWGW